MKSKSIVIDLDDTISITFNKNYEEAQPKLDVIEKLRKYHEDGFKIIIHTSRNMKTFEGNIGKINAYTLPIILDWLKKHEVPFDEVIVGKPWCGEGGFYVDDKAIRPDEFVNLKYDEISKLINK